MYVILEADDTILKYINHDSTIVESEFDTPILLLYSIDSIVILMIDSNNDDNIDNLIDKF